MNWLTHFLNWLKALFGKSAPIVQGILTASSAIVQQALPIVTELAALAAAFPTATGLLGAIEQWLPAIVQDTTKVDSWLKSTANAMSIPDILRSAAQVALKELVPNSTLASEINFAIEFALQIFKKTPTASAPIAAVAAMVQSAPLAK